MCDGYAIVQFLLKETDLFISLLLHSTETEYSVDVVIRVQMYAIMGPKLRCTKIGK